MSDLFKQDPSSAQVVLEQPRFLLLVFVASQCKFLLKIVVLIQIVLILVRKGGVFGILAARLLQFLCISLQFVFDRLEPVQRSEQVRDTQNAQEENNPQCKAIVGDESFRVVALVQFLAPKHHVLDVAERDGGHQSVESFKRLGSFVTVCKALILVYHVTQVVVCVFALLLHQVD